MASKYWIKLYHEMLDDPKVARLNDSTYRRFIECLLLAGELDEEGLLPPVADMAWRLRQSETALAQDLSRLAIGEMVELKQHEGEERWFISKFAKRQSPTPGAQRVRAYRERKRKEEKKKNAADIYTDTDTDIYTYRNAACNVTGNVTNVTDSYAHIYDGHEENQIVRDVITKICCVVKGESPLVPSAEIDTAARTIISLKAVDKIDGFSGWWEKNGYYAGRPALKSFVGEFQNYLDGVVIKQKQQDGKVKVGAV